MRKTKTRRPVKPTVKPKSKHTGRPTDYDPAKLPALVKMLEDGRTQATAAQRIFGVAPQTFSLWKSRFPELREAIQQGEQRYWEQAVDNVERVGVAAATGRIPKTVEEKRDAAGNLTGERVIEYHPSSAVDRFFILCNKRPHKWQNVQRVEVRHDGEGPRPIVFVVERGTRRVALDGSAAIVAEGPSGNGRDGPKALEAENTKENEDGD